MTLTAYSLLAKLLLVLLLYLLFLLLFCLFPSICMSGSRLNLYVFSGANSPSAGDKDFIGLV